jgi:hypothetical protein
VSLGLPHHILCMCTRVGFDYPPYYRIYMSSLYMSKPPNPSFHYNAVISNSIMSSLTTHPMQHPHLCYANFILVLVLYRPTLLPIQHRRSYDCMIKFPFSLGSTFVISNSIMSSLTVLPQIQRKILIFTTLILFSCWLFTSQHSFHTTSSVLRLYDKIFPLAWAVPLDHIEDLIPSSIIFNHPCWIQWFTFLYISLSFCTMDPRYLNCVTWGMIWSPTFTSKLEMLRLLPKLHWWKFFGGLISWHIDLWGANLLKYFVRELIWQNLDLRTTKLRVYFWCIILN